MQSQIRERASGELCRGRRWVSGSGQEAHCPAETMDESIIMKLEGKPWVKRTDVLAV